MRNAVDRTWGMMARIPSTVVLVIAVIGFLGTVVALAIAIPLSGRVAQQAEAGNRARDRQIQVGPIGCKMLVDTYRRGVITRGDLITYSHNAATPCPVPGG